LLKPIGQSNAFYNCIINPKPPKFGFRRIGYGDMAVCQNLVPLMNPKIAGKWMFIPLKMVLIGIDPYPYGSIP
jgi:hypothetical protein